jgi:methylaspartate mutase epsilon subunit
MEIRNRKLSEEQFSKERKNVLAMWPTGSDIDLNEAVEYHKSMAPEKNGALKVVAAKSACRTELFCSSGTDTIAAHIELLQYCRKVGGVDYASSYIDSFTRTGRFEMAEKGLKEAQKTGKQVLNGFPFVCHGVGGTRQVIEAVDMPVFVWGPAVDLRLVMEIGLAGGHTGYAGGPLISFWNYAKNVPLEKVIGFYQYVNRLMGYYEDRGVPILYGVSGVMPTVTPPSLMTASKIIETLIAAEQGCKHIMLNNWAQGNLAQDIGSILTHSKLTDEYLRKFGYNNVETVTFSVDPTGRYPVEECKVYSLISYFAMVGILARVQMMAVRTVDEAKHVPTKESISASHQCARMMINMLKEQKNETLSSEAVMTEARMEELETRAILDRVIDMGDGDVVIGAIRSVDAGVLDQSYATTQLVKGRVLGVKDAHGAARYLDHGNLPFSQELIEFHREKIAEREGKIARKVDYGVVVKDITAIAEGSLLPERWQE